MNIETAKRISDEMLDISKRLNSHVAFIQTNCADDEFKRYRRAYGEILANIYLEVLVPVYREHPSIKPPLLNFEAQAGQ